jgi:hypothetical protein
MSRSGLCWPALFLARWSEELFFFMAPANLSWRRGGEAARFIEAPASVLELAPLTPESASSETSTKGTRLYPCANRNMDRDARRSLLSLSAKLLAKSPVGPKCGD